MPHRSTWGSTRVGQEAEEVRGEMWARASMLASPGKNGQDRIAGLGLAALNNSSGL